MSDPQQSAMLNGPDVDYRELFGAFPTPYAILDTELTIRDCTEAYLQLVGRAREEVVGRQLLDALPVSAEPASAAAQRSVGQALHRALSSGKPVVLPAYRQHVPGPDDGTDTELRYWASTVVPLLDGRDTVRNLLYKVQDVTAIAAAADREAAQAVQDSDAAAEALQVARDLAEDTRLLRAKLDEQRQVALTLQSAMLPAGVPEVAQSRTAVRYRPGSGSLTVCGDWYDVAALPDGRIAMAVGDVVGQGLEAAAVMGQLRSALSALTIADVGPASALEALDRYARQSEKATATTCIKVVLDLVAHHATYSSAGHLPPVLLHPSGEVELFTEALGPPLAVTDEAETRPQATVGFEEGALIVLYTDGLVERRREDIDEGIGRLIDSLLRHRDLDPEPLADALLTDLMDDSTGHDDTALLVIRL